MTTKLSNNLLDSLLRFAFSLNIRKNVVYVVRNYVPFFGKRIGFSFFTVFFFGCPFFKNFLLFPLFLHFLNFLLGYKVRIKLSFLFLFFDGRFLTALLLSR